MKTGQVTTEQLFLDKIDPKLAINVGRNPSGVKGVPLKVAGEVSTKAYMAKTRRPASGGGNQNNANWRRRHGGSWLMPPSTKFKVKGG